MSEFPATKEIQMSPLLIIHGPNLNDQSKGTFHVHTADCADNRSYGPGSKYGGESVPVTLNADSKFEVSEFFYADHTGDQGFEPGSEEYDEFIEQCVGEFWFAPCVERNVGDFPYMPADKPAVEPEPVEPQVSAGEAAIADLTVSARNEAEEADRRILDLTARLRADLDRVDAAITGGHRVPSSVSGLDVIGNRARELDATVADRQNAYTRLSMYANVLQKIRDAEAGA